VQNLEFDQFIKGEKITSTEIGKLFIVILDCAETKETTLFLGKHRHGWLVREKKSDQKAKQVLTQSIKNILKDDEQSNQAVFLIYLKFKSAIPFSFPAK
jgi:hypothetical protein